MSLKPVSQCYRIRDFAERVGVTAKALRHYERLGLLKPRRTAAGYRVYSESDRTRLDRILALKFLGVPLREIPALLNRPEPSLAQVLRRQRARLEEKKGELESAIRALDDAEEALKASAPGTGLWRKIVEVLAMKSDVDAMKKYYSEEAWARRRQYYDEWPSPAWQQICREAASILGEDPAGPRAQSLKARWTEMVNQSVTGDPAVQEGALAAWNDRAYWPAALRAKIEEFQVEKVVDYFARILTASWKAYMASEAWARLTERQRNPTEPWNEWYRRLRTALEEDPPAEKTRAMVLRMTEL